MHFSASCNDDASAFKPWRKSFLSLSIHICIHKNYACTDADLAPEDKCMQIYLKMQINHR